MESQTDMNTPSRGYDDAGSPNIRIECTEPSSGVFTSPHINRTTFPSADSMPALEGNASVDGVSIESISPPRTPLKGCYAPFPDSPRFAFSPSLEFAPAFGDEPSGMSPLMLSSPHALRSKASLGKRSQRIGLGLGVAMRPGTVEPLEKSDSACDSSSSSNTVASSPLLGTATEHFSTRARNLET